MIDSQFQRQLEAGFRLTTIDVFYFLPDQRSLVGEFVWQTLDVPPTFPRVYKFLEFWKTNIQAVIQEVILTSVDHIGHNKLHKVDKLLYLM